MRESEFIEWIRSQSNFDPAAVPIGPGDDSALVHCGGDDLLITMDQVLDGVHFVLAEHGPALVGRKAMARNLSDVAAMAALPLAATSSVALPKGFSQADARKLYQGMRDLGQEFSCPIVGGDVGVWGGPLAVSVTVVARPAGIRPIIRGGAKVGDAICVTGAFGGSLRSRRHLRFVPRIPEARKLASRCTIHAMIDVSDGLARDLEHICQASKVGADLLTDAIPIHADAKAPNLAIPPLEAALKDGEDYELLFAVPADQVDNLIQTQPLGAVKVSRIGTIVEGNAMTLVMADGKREKLDTRGWEHET